jgi:hypothetical protein
MFGYNGTEVDIRKDVDLKNDLVFSTIDNTRDRRPLMSFSQNYNVEGVARPHPNTASSINALHANIKRACVTPGTPDPELRSEFRDFVTNWCETNLIPLSPGTDVSFDTWIENTPYTQSRKDALKNTYHSYTGPLENPKFSKVEQFIKDEDYPEYKPARAINSRIDLYKTLIGPWFKVIENEIFKLKYFIKKVPAHKRVELLNTLVEPGAQYVASDHSFFEAAFTPDLIIDCEYIMYTYMLKAIPNNAEFHKLFKYILGRNSIHNQWFKLQINGTRMSGEMNTSLGNGFSNLMFMLFVAHKMNAKADGFVEGDDSLFKYDKSPDVGIFKKLGLSIKLVVHDKIHTASFCGNVFNPDTMVSFTDPAKLLVSFGWLPSRYVRSKHATIMALYRAKALSYIHQYYGNPIIHAFCLRVLKDTHFINMNRLLSKSNYFDSYKRAQVLDANEWFKTNSIYNQMLNYEIKISDRVFMENVYGISVDQQIWYEQYFLNAVNLINIPNYFNCHPSWSHFHDSYVLPYDYEPNPAKDWFNHYKIGVKLGDLPKFRFIDSCLGGQCVKYE